MFERLKNLVLPGLKNSASEIDDSDSETSVALAAAMLLLEVAWADHEIEAHELDAIRKAFRAMYGMDPVQIDELIDKARADHQSSTSLYPFTRTLNDQLDRDEKVVLLEHLWRLANFEGDRHHYEEHVIRKISDLLYLSHSDFIATKLAAKQ